MLNKVKQNLKDRIDLIHDDESLFRVFDQLGLDFDDDIFKTEEVWATIKEPAAVPHLSDDKEGHRLKDKRVQAYATNTSSVKLFFDGTWYINRKFNLKLRPEWIEIIKEN